MNRYRMFKIPHYLQSSTINLPNMEGFVCTTTNIRPKVMVSQSNSNVVGVCVTFQRYRISKSDVKFSVIF